MPFHVGALRCILLHDNPPASLYCCSCIMLSVPKDPVESTRPPLRRTRSCRHLHIGGEPEMDCSQWRDAETFQYAKLASRALVRASPWQADLHAKALRAFLLTGTCTPQGGSGGWHCIH